MAYVIPRSTGRWELRESHATHRGPRSRTLASFRSLSDEVIDRARSRATKALAREDIRAAARRAGAPVDVAAADHAASELLKELEAGREPSPALRKLLVDGLGDGPPDVDLANARTGAMWLTATAQERGDALADLLLLADAIPRRPNREPLRFPRLGKVA